MAHPPHIALGCLGPSTIVSAATIARGRSPARPGRPPLACLNGVAVVFQDRQFLLNFREYKFPITVGFLPEQPRRWIPRAVSAVEQPAPVRDVFQANPGWTSQCAGDMGDGSVSSDNQVKTFHHRRGIDESIRPIVKIIAQHFHARANWQARELIEAVIFLQAD